MATFNGIFDIDGTLQNMTFYKSKTKGGIFIKTKSGVSKERILTDPDFVRTVENGTEFGRCAQSGKLMRDAFVPVIKGNSDSLMVSRVTRVMTEIKNLDATNVRGQRVVGVGIETQAGMNLLLNFNFNIKAILRNVLSAAYSVDTSTGIITVPGFVPNLALEVPEGATNVSLTGAWSIVDFVNGVSSTTYTNVENLPIDGTSTDVTLTPNSMPFGKETNLFVLQVGFFQTINGIQYPLNNGGYNSVGIVGVA